MELRHSFTNLKKLENQSMEDYLRQIKATADALAAIWDPLSELELIDFTLSGLDPEYDTIATAMSYFPGQHTFDDLLTKLIMFEHKLKLRSRHFRPVLDRQGGLLTDGVPRPNPLPGQVVTITEIRIRIRSAGTITVGTTATMVRETEAIISTTTALIVALLATPIVNLPLVCIRFPHFVILLCYIIVLLMLTMLLI